MSSYRLNLNARVPFCLFFLIAGLLHQFGIHEFYFQPYPAWNDEYVVSPIRAAGPLSLLGAFLLAIPRRSTEIFAALVLGFVALVAVPAHGYAATGKLIFNEWQDSSLFSAAYVLLDLPITGLLIWLVFGPRGKSQGKEKDSKTA